MKSVAAGRGSSSRFLVVSGLSLAMLAALSSQASAQVLEIGDDGAVTRYDRPSVFGPEDAVPILQAARRARGAGGGPPTSTPPQTLIDAAELAALSPDLVEAVAWRESRLRAGVVSGAGAVGEMQLMPATARALGVDPRDSGQNYRGGAAYLGALLRRYDGDLLRALAAYNAGPGAVARFHGVPPYRETQAYVAAIMDRLGARAAMATTEEKR